MTDQSDYSQIEPFIKPSTRRDTLKELTDAPLLALEARLKTIIEQATKQDPGSKKDGKDGSVEGPLTFGDARLAVDELRIKDDKQQSEKYKESTDKKDSSDSKESSDAPRSTNVFGRMESLALDRMKAVEEYTASRLGITPSSGAPII